MELRSAILGTGHYVPRSVITNHDLSRVLETSDAWITDRTGIARRRIAEEGELTSDMAARASHAALEDAECDASEIDLVVVATFTPDSPLPSCAAHVQHKIGARHVPAFDVASACTGFLTGLGIADQYVRSGAARRVLVVGVEMLSRVTDWSDRGTAVLFGDGAGAAIVGPADGDRGILSSRTYTDGSLAGLLEIPAGGTREPLTAARLAARRDRMRMDGPAVFRHAVRGLASSSEAVLAEAGLRPADVDWVVPHQANGRIVAQVAERLGVPMARVIVNLAEYGNTSSASIPIALDEAVRDGRIRRGQYVLLCAFGAGLTWGAAVLRM